MPLGEKLKSRNSWSVLRSLGGSFRDISGLSRFFGSLGVLGTLLLGFGGKPALGNGVALFVMLALSIAIILAVPALLPRVDVCPDREETKTGEQSHLTSKRFLLAPCLVVSISALICQSWFKSGTAIAGGDLTPPSGTAWLSQLFSSWTWSGLSLGAPGAFEVRSPWALMLWIVHETGGSSALAQRIWLSLLFSGAALAAFGLMRALRIKSISAVIGSLAYVLNPYVTSSVGFSDISLAAMVLLAAFPAVIFLVASGHWRIRTGVVAFALSAPILGFVYQSPPLLGMIIGATVLSLFLVAWLDGGIAFRKAAKFLGVALIALFVTSAYWIIPSVFALSSVDQGNLTSIGSWTWVESRATIKNALWLNTTWTYKFREYVPYSNLYSVFPLSFLKYLLMGLAFASLPLSSSLSLRERNGVRRRGRLVLALMGLAIFLMIFSTGTNYPGDVIFLPLYSLPYGWLLREPGRFLMLAALCVAVLFAVTVEILVERYAITISKNGRGGNRKIAKVWPVAVGALVALLVFAPSFPLLNGSVVPAKRFPLPSSHVRVPAYWSEMSRFLNTTTLSGSVLTLPPDDYYQMPYKWGYYGDDAFISDMISRHVLDPTGQVYFSSSSDILDTVNQVSASLLANQWALGQRLASALGTPLILVRGDINSKFPKRNIVSAGALEVSLKRDPFARLIYKAGPLELFDLHAKLRAKVAVKHLVTVNSPTPNLASLGLFAPGTALITRKQLPGVAALIQLPPVGDWFVGKKSLSLEVREISGWRYSAPVQSPGYLTGPNHAVTQRAVSKKGVVIDRLTYPLGKELLPNGKFSQGQWQSVGNCDAVPGTSSIARLKAKLFPRGGPSGSTFLELSASTDIACEAHSLAWTSGPLMLRMWARNVSGAAPRFCLWEQGPNVCAKAPPLVSRSGWQQYQAVIVPDTGTTALGLFLYSDGGIPGHRTINDFADLAAYSVPGGSPLDILATPSQQFRGSISLLTNGESYSKYWRGPVGADHVIVDGMRNGWVLSSSEAEKGVTYGPKKWILISFVVSGLTGMVLLGYSGLRLADTIVPRMRRRLRQ